MNSLATVRESGIFSRIGQTYFGAVIDIAVKQALLRSVLPDGTVILLVVLHDDRCAILRNNDVVHVARGDAEGIDDAVHRFMTLTQSSRPAPGEEAVAGGLRRDANGAATPPPAPAPAPPSSAPRPSSA